MRLAALLSGARDTLIAHRAAEGYWPGHLSSSALSTATAVGALALHARTPGGSAAAEDSALIDRGVYWLVRTQNADGGWGDTTASASNISTTLLAWAALAFAPPDSTEARRASRDAESWIRDAAGTLEPQRLSAAITARYGRDRTFSVPILTMCALAGRLGPEADAWRAIPALPFELAAAPRALFRWLRLPVVSYALPALISMGLARHRRSPTRNPVTRTLRTALAGEVLRILQLLQPSNGGFLEATPLTSFVAMSLVGAGESRHEVTRRALAFVRASVREDGSWPVDTHLATWVTTLAVNALEAAGSLSCLEPASLAALTRWLVEQQHTREHVYTGAAGGGWAWTPLPGGVPDADDTAGAILALAALPENGESRRAAIAGIEWLLGLQNRDGGIPTFCRGWGALPFDRSGADLTAHAVRAWASWADRLEPALARRVDKACNRAVAYLREHQRGDGAFLPLWFGSEGAPEEANPTYGTSRVLTSLADVTHRRRADTDGMLQRAAQWLRGAQNDDGGWGADRMVASSLEETALAVGALADYAQATGKLDDVHDALVNGCRWLAVATAGGRTFNAGPIGLYFAKLWYSESLYPIVFCVEGAARAAGVLGAGAHPDP